MTVRDSRVEAITAIEWRRSSRCSPAGDDCVEVWMNRGSTAVRNSKDLQHRIVVGSAAWRAFLQDGLCSLPRE